VQHDKGTDAKFDAKHLRAGQLKLKSKFIRLLDASLAAALKKVIPQPFSLNEGDREHGRLRGAGVQAAGAQDDLQVHEGRLAGAGLHRYQVYAGAKQILVTIPELSKYDKEALKEVLQYKPSFLKILQFQKEQKLLPKGQKVNGFQSRANIGLSPLKLFSLFEFKQMKRKLLSNGTIMNCKGELCDITLKRGYA